MTFRRGSGERASASAHPTAAEMQFVVDAASALHGNGAGSDRTASRVAEVAARLDSTARLQLGWSESAVTLTARDGQPTVARFARPPSGIGMNRVLGVDTAVNGFSAGRLTLAQAQAAVQKAVALPAANVFLFAAACALGASALAVIFGVSHWQTVLLIAVSAGAGAFLRRGIARLGGSNFWQVGLAALLAGLLGAFAADLDISSALRLAAVCPCMVLVPGPHLLNGSLDLGALRIPLGLARLTFAVLTLLSIGAGLLAGLTLGGADLVVDPISREIPLWLDALSAGVVAVCYGIFYSSPWRILAWPFVVGAAVHAVRWVALEVWHAPAYLGAGLACLIAAAILLPISRRFQIPFSAVGFASVVSLMPGVLIFRALAGLAELQSQTGVAAQRVLVDTVNNANLAWLTIFAMAIGFIIPATIYGWIDRHRRVAAGTAAVGL